jgi:hypothetical protein
MQKGSLIRSSLRQRPDVWESSTHVTLDTYTLYAREASGSNCGRQTVLSRREDCLGRRRRN